MKRKPRLFLVENGTALRIGDTTELIHWYCPDCGAGGLVQQTSQATTCPKCKSRNVRHQKSAPIPLPPVGEIADSFGILKPKPIPKSKSKPKFNLLGTCPKCGMELYGYLSTKWCGKNDGTN